MDAQPIPQPQAQAPAQVAPGAQSGFQAKVKKFIKPEMMRYLNIFACLLLMIGAVLRIIDVFKAFNLFFFITSLYFFVFIVFVAAIEIHQLNKFSVFVRTHFNFLDQMFGRGLFMIFLSFMLIERKRGVFLSVIVIIISCFDLMLGFGDAQKALASLPWESVSAPASSGTNENGGAGQQPKSGGGGGNGIAYDANTDTYQVKMSGAQAREAAMNGVAQGLEMQRPSTVPLSQPMESPAREPVAAQQKPVVAVKEESSVDLEDPYAA